MKKILLSIAVFIATNCSAQDIHYDTLSGMCYVDIQPVKWTHNNSDSARHLYVRAFNDNLLNFAQLYWELRDNARNVINSGNKDISGQDYILWDSESKYLFTYLAKPENLNLQIKD
jgi:hypothetical protein